MTSRGQKGGPFVGRLPGAAAEDREVMPMNAAAEVRASARWCQASAVTAVLLSLVADAQDAAEQHLLDDDDGGQHDKRERLGRRVRSAELANRRDGDAAGRREQHQRDDRGRQGLGLAVTIGVRLVGRSAGDAESAPHDERRKDVGRRFDGVGDQGIGVAEDARPRACPPPERG